MERNTGEVQRKTFLKRYRIIPWGICGLSFLVQFLAMSFYGSFGPLYVEMLRVFKNGDSATAWVPSISFSIAYAISPLTYQMGDRIGFRNTTTIGALLYGLGLFISSFATSISILYFTIGIMVAVGHSICQATSMFILPHYFGDNFALPLGIALSGSGFGALVLSSMKSYLFDKYGYRTGMQLLATTAIPVVLAGLAFKKQEGKGGKMEDVDGKVEGSPAIEDEFPPLRHNKAYLMLLLASFVYHTVYLVPFVHLTRLAGDLGISDTKSALLPGFTTVVESLGKIVVGKLLAQLKNAAVNIYVISWAGIALSHLLCPFAKEFYGLVAYSIAFGFSVGVASGGCVLTIEEVVGNRRLVKGYSVFLMGFSPAVLIGPPVAGYIRETSQRYDTAFYFCGGTVALGAIILLGVKTFTKLNRRRYEVKMENEACLLTDDLNKNELAMEVDREKVAMMKGNGVDCEDKGNRIKENEFFFNFDEPAKESFTDKTPVLNAELNRNLRRETTI